VGATGALGAFPEDKENNFLRDAILAGIFSARL